MPKLFPKTLLSQVSLASFNAAKPKPANRMAMSRLEKCESEVSHCLLHEAVGNGEPVNL